MHLHHHMLSSSRDWPGLLAQPDSMPRRSRERSEASAVIGALFSCFFAAQSGQLALTPVLTDAAADFGLSTAGAGQIRSAAAVVAAATAIALVIGVSRVRLATLLWLGLALVASGSVLSLFAGSVGVLTVGQALAGGASSIVMAAGVAAAAAWSDPGNRGRVVAWTLVGAPTAWVVTMPVIGVVAQADWHLAFVVPVVAATMAGVALRRAPTRPSTRSRPGLQGVVTDRALQAWAISEVLSYAAWSGVLIYAGALLVESYGTSLSGVGLALGLGAAAYIPGTFVAQRVTARRAGRALLAAATIFLAFAVIVFGAVRPNAAATTIGFGALCFVTGARTYLGSAVGLALAADRHAAAMSVRAAAAQIGWILGGLLGGIALAAGGYAAVGLVLGALYATGGLLHVWALMPLVPRGRGRATLPERLERGAAPARAR